MTSQLNVNDIARMIDHSLLHPTLTDQQIKEGCELARHYNVATVCVKPYAVPKAAALLKNTMVNVCAVVGFPHGNSHSSIKTTETELAITQGAAEIDMVINIGKALGAEWDYVASDIRAINHACTAKNALVKVIFENDYLQESHIIKLCEICSVLNVAFVKTSTGYGFVKQPDGSYNYQGATHHHIKLMRSHCAPQVRIKAAGGIRTLDQLLQMHALGAARIGLSATQEIMQEAKQRQAAGTLALPASP